MDPKGKSGVKHSISDVITGVREPHKMPLSPKRKRPYLKWIIAAIVVVIFLALSIIYWSNKKGKDRTFHDQGISFRYPKTYNLQPPNTKAGPNLIAQLKKSAPESNITIAKEKDADKGAQAAHRNFLDDLELSASRTLPNTYPNFIKDSDNRIKIDGFDAADYSFHYTGRDKRTTVYAHLLIIPRGHDAYYVTLESVNQKTLKGDTAEVRSSLRLP
ncbi:hypothetical protein HY218_01220 [Candidatus Saccharibacteria bacterium]|nr:hypothetical protein [Candidatus Saccharibacteria bacterium]